MPHLENGDKYDNSPEKVISPSKLAHIVLHTTQDHFKPMIEFYKTFLGAQASYENDFISFITYDDEHHRIAVVAIPETIAKNPKVAGLHHVAFTFDSLEDLAVVYRQRKAKVSRYNPVKGLGSWLTPDLYRIGGAPGYKAVGRAHIYDIITTINTIDLPSCLYALPVNLDKKEFFQCGVSITA
jgi:hypothetical protein